MTGVQTCAFRSSKTEKEFIKHTDDVGKILMSLAGKAGIATDDLNKFASQMAELNKGMIIAGGTQDKTERVINQFANLKETLGQLKLGRIGEQFIDAINKARTFNPEGIDWLVKMGMDPTSVIESIKSQDFTSVINAFTESLKYFGATADGSSIWKSQYLSSFLKETEISTLQTAGATGELNHALHELEGHLDKKRKPDNLTNIFNSIGTSWSSLKQMFYDFMVSVGEAPLTVLAHSLKIVADAARYLQSQFKALPEDVKWAISAFVGLTLTGITVVKVWGTLATFGKALGAVFTGLGIKTTALGIAFRLLSKSLGITLIIGSIYELISQWNQLSVGQKVFLGIAGGAGVLLLQLKFLMPVLTAVKEIFQAFVVWGAADGFRYIGLTLAKIGPVGWAIVAAIVAIGAATYVVYTYWDDIKKAWNDSSSSLNQMLQQLRLQHPFLALIYDTWKDIFNIFQAFSETGTLWEGPANRFKSAMINAVLAVVDFIRTYLPTSVSKFLGFEDAHDKLQGSKESLQKEYNLLKSVEEYRQSDKFKPEMQKMLPKGVDLPGIVSKPKEWMDAMKTFKEIGGNLAPGSGFPKVLNEITAAGLGTEFNNWMKKSLPLTKDLSGDVRGNFYSQGIELFSKMATGNTEQQNQAKIVLEKMLEMASVKKEELGKESDQPVDVNGIPGVQSSLSNLESLNQQMVELLSNLQNTKSEGTLGIATQREQFNYLHENQRALL